MDLRGWLDVEADDGVRFSFAVSNAGRSPVELQFRTGMAADFAVTDGETEIWRYADERMFTQALWSEQLGVGESVTYDGSWETPEPGDYEVVATLAATNAEVEARAAFEI